MRADKESRAPTDWCFWIVLEKAQEFIGQQDLKPVNLKENQPWILIGRIDAEAEAPVFWSSDSNSQLTRKVPDAGKDWGQKEKRASEDEMAGWHHWCNGHELGQPWEMVGEREACHAAVHGIAESNMTGQLDKNNLKNKEKDSWD